MMDAAALSVAWRALMDAATATHHRFVGCSGQWSAAHVGAYFTSCGVLALDDANRHGDSAVAVAAVALMGDEALSAFEVMSVLEERLKNGEMLDTAARVVFPVKADGSARTADEMRRALVARFQDAGGRKSLDELYGLASFAYPPRVMSRVSVVRLTINAPQLKRLLGSVSAGYGSDIVDDLTAKLGVPVVGSKLMQALVLEKAFVKISGCASWSPEAWAELAGKYEKIMSWIAELDEPGAPPVGAVPPAPTPALKFTSDERSISLAVASTIADVSSEAHRQALALPKMEAAAILAEVNKPTAADEIKRAFATDGKATSNNTVLSELLGARGGVDAMWKQRWGDSKMYLAPIPRLFPDLPKFLRTGQLSKIQLSEIGATIKQYHQYKCASLQFAASDSASLFPMCISTVSELMRILEPEGASSLFGEFMQDPEGLKAHSERHHSLLSAGANHTYVQGFLKRVEDDFELSMHLWATSSQAFKTKPSLKVLPDTLKREMEKKLAFLEEIDEKDQMIADGVIGSGHQRHSVLDPSVAKQLSALQSKLDQLSAERSGRKTAQELSAPSSAAASAASSRAPSPGPAARQPGSGRETGKERRDRQQRERSNSRTRDDRGDKRDREDKREDKRDERGGKEPPRGILKNPDSKKARFADGEKGSSTELVSLSMLIPKSNSRLPHEWSREFVTAGHASKWSAPAGTVGDKQKPCWVHWLQPKTGMSCSWGDSCKFNHNIDRDFGDKDAKMLLEAVAAGLRERR